MGQLLAHSGIIGIIAGEGAQLIEKGIAAGEIVLGLDVDQRVDQAAGERRAHSGIVGIIVGEGAQLIEQGVAAGEIALRRGVVQRVE